MGRIEVPESAGEARIVRALVLGLVGFLAIETALILLDAVFPPALGRGLRASPVTLDARGQWLRALPVEGGRWRIRADLERTDPRFLRRLLALEDARFLQHPGVDARAVVRAAGSAVLRGRIVSGASTLSMQTARLLEPRPRNLGSKLVEMLRAVQIEARLSKRQILGMYLTLAPYGGNLEGVRSASLAYFGHEPASLTDGEQALLIALPQSPEARRPDRRPEAARAARAQVLARLVRAHLISAEDASEASAEPIPHRSPFPALAWHAAGQLAARAGVDQASVVSTIDAGLQSRLERLAAQTAAAQGPQTTSAIIVVRIRDRAVRALVGSVGLERPGGWLDMTLALRSPGSALKPFIYGMAFDDGLAAPDTVIQDAPRRFADYQPENFDRVFHGPVTARDALTHSLNVPAVELLSRLGPEKFQARLETAGVRLVRSGARIAEPGLPLALGGEGVTLRDVAILYAALGDGGIAKPLAWTVADADRRPGQAGQRLMRAEAARQVLDILRETPAPAGRMPSALTRSGPRMAFKTGTSYGFRDALAAGVVGGYAVVVWTGRADGGARGGLTGREAALPLLFDAADAIDAPLAAPRPIPPSRAPEALQQLETVDTGPKLIFPPDGAAVQVDGLGPEARGLALAARGKGLSWYVDGAKLAPDPATGSLIWRPGAAGFYSIMVVDEQGRSAKARVRIRGG